MTPTATNGRPPHRAAEPARCEWLWPNGRQCGAYAVWAIPEAPYCWHHIPDEWRVTAHARELRWHDAAAEQWARIIREVPL